MSKSELSQKFAQSLKLQKLRERISIAHQKTQLKGLSGSSFSFSVAAAFQQQENPFLLIFDSKEEAAFHLNDLEFILPNEDVLFFPGSYRRPYEIEETDNANVLLRAEVLNKIK